MDENEICEKRGAYTIEREKKRQELSIANRFNIN